MGDITQLISSVGFPIVVCIGMWNYINTTMKELTNVINNNNVALERILAVISKEDKD